MEQDDYLKVYNKCYSVLENRKQAKERAKLGFCNRDVEWWPFLWPSFVLLYKKEESILWKQALKN